MRLEVENASNEPSTPSVRADAFVVRRCRWIALAAGVLVTLAGLLGLIGWIIANDRLKGAFGDSPTMKANTAVALLLTGLCLLGRHRSQLNDDPRIRWICNVLAGFVLLVGALTLSEHIFGWDLHIDQLLFTETVGARATASPNRMGPPGSTSFVLAGAALLLLNFRTRRGHFPSHYLAVLVGLIAMLPLIGYAYAIQSLYSVARYTGIAAPTAIAFLILAVGILCARPTWGLMEVVTSDDVGGILARRLLVPAVLLPFVLGWLRTVGERQGLYDAAFGRSVLILSLIAALGAVVWWNARIVGRVGREREHAQAQRDELLKRERAAREEAERLNRMKDEFLATLSHELRTPLNAILGWSQLLAARKDLDSEMSDGLAVIQRNVRLQGQLVEDLLDMSRIISGKVRLDVQPVDLAKVVAAAVESMTPAAEAKGVRLQVALDRHAGPLLGDPNRLQQVAWNLIHNAIKFTPRGGRVQVAVARVNSHVELVVADTGEGISAAFLPQIFERFQQADASTTRRHGGLGLGLAIVKQLIELHGGRVSVASEGEGKGTTFVVALPLSAARLPEDGETVPAHDRQHPRTSAMESAPVDAPDLSGVRVLVVDDEPDAREVIRRLLEQCRVTVTTAGSATEALAALDDGTFDALLSDIGMPGQDGFSLIEQVRARPATQGGTVPAAALTAYARSEDRTRALRAGFQMHLSKPIESAELLAALASLSARTGKSPSSIERG